MHVIRLRGPWRYLLASSASGKFTLPATRAAVVGNDPAGRIEFSRAFNRPTNLQDERVLLVLRPATPLLAAWLNDQPLTPLDDNSFPTRYDITQVLASGNTLRLEMELPATTHDEEPLVGEVCLEIHA